jgi:hypothetical protein
MVTGEMVENGGMELFEGQLPIGWSTDGDPDLIVRVTDGGLVHTGEASVSMKNGANLFQEISPIQEGCFYEFSFFAHAEGSNVGLTANLYFINVDPDIGEVPAGEIFIRQGDIPTASRVFSYYRVVTSQAPLGTESVLITFEAVAQGNQSVDIDDVSFSSL